MHMERLDSCTNRVVKEGKDSEISFKGACQKDAPVYIYNRLISVILIF